MRRFLATVVASTALAATAMAWAQRPLVAGEKMPPGHPTTPSPAASQQPPAHSRPAAAAGSPLPPGHPSAQGAAPRDSVGPDPQLSPGDVDVVVRNALGRPVPNVEVALSVLRQDVAEGDSRSTRKARTGASGLARFRGLPTGTAYSYRAIVEQGAATYASSAFRPAESAGHRVSLHVFPITHDIKQAMVGMQAIVYVQPRDDVFQFEVSFRVFNIGRVTWVPRGLTIPLPPGAKAFNAQEGESDARVEKVGDTSIEWHGTFSPGQHDVSYRFQLDNEHTARAAFDMALPPHVAEIRLIAEAGRTMRLVPSGLPEPQRFEGQNGLPLLATGKKLSRGEAPVARLSFAVEGIPVPGRGRWYATGLALAAALLGLSAAFGGKKGSGSTVPSSDARQARELLLAELVTLERLRQAEKVGPRTYETTRTTLLEALARVESSQTSS